MAEAKTRMKTVVEGHDLLGLTTEELMMLHKGLQLYCKALSESEQEKCMMSNPFELGSEQPVIYRPYQAKFDTAGTLATIIVEELNRKV